MLSVEIVAINDCENFKAIELLKNFVFSDEDEFEISNNHEVVASLKDFTSIRPVFANYIQLSITLVPSPGLRVDREMIIKPPVQLPTELTSLLEQTNPDVLTNIKVLQDFFYVAFEVIK
jgi:hypothetical protein